VVDVISVKNIAGNLVSVQNSFHGRVKWRILQCGESVGKEEGKIRRSKK
jgi:hypothetical protein